MKSTQNPPTTRRQLPGLADMKSMLRLAVETCGLPRARRPEHILRGICRLSGGAFAIAWVIARDGEIFGTLVSAPDAPTLPPDADPGAALLLRSRRVIMPVVRLREELLNRDLWRQAVPRPLRRATQALYSLHRVDAQRRSLIAVYGTDAGRPFAERERLILRLLHSQCAGCLHPPTKAAPVFRAIRRAD